MTLMISKRQIKVFSTYLVISGRSIHVRGYTGYAGVYWLYKGILGVQGIQGYDSLLLLYEGNRLFGVSVT